MTMNDICHSSFGCHVTDSNMATRARDEWEKGGSIVLAYLAWHRGYDEGWWLAVVMCCCHKYWWPCPTNTEPPDYTNRPWLMVPADGPMGKLTPLKVDRPLIFFLRTGTVGWPCPPDELIDPAKFALDGGSTGLFIQRVLWVSWWISPRKRARPMCSWAQVDNMTLAMSIGLGLILAPSFFTYLPYITFLSHLSCHNLQPG